MKLITFVTIISFILLQACSAHLTIMGIGTVFQAIDYKQTSYISKHPDKFYETNPILGRHPDQQDVNLWFATSILSLWTIYLLLPKKWKPYWASGYAGITFTNVWRNYQLDHMPIP
ncbi:MAG: hypothetical protein KatS3mg002_0411 [Candidatus Woesearchaeota archaeon]|nr:MAG: hypothetical protein KatS3mg002_0411 [Candidatus Woesearchaeota archaeon]